ncbi:MAG: hemerythrin family protein [SAR324 cluster bacterium]|nr:hemerythrin family protein [SAR324 cluster bacterium]
MSLLTWSEAFSVKINSIDEQHKKLINMINGLHDAMQLGDSKKVIEKILEGLAVYTVKHFGYEEELFRKYGYPQSEQHIREHQALVNQVVALQKRLSTEESFMLGVEILEFLKNWLINHIQGSDMKYSAFLVEKGVI